MPRIANATTESEEHEEIEVTEEMVRAVLGVLHDFALPSITRQAESLELGTVSGRYSRRSTIVGGLARKSAASECASSIKSRKSLIRTLRVLISTVLAVN
jgi:hypothetical protein